MSGNGRVPIIITIVVAVVVVSSSFFTCIGASPITAGPEVHGTSENPNYSSSYRLNTSQTSSIDQYAGYVEYTLFLNNNTLINGNYAGNGSMIHPDSIAYDPSNNRIYVSNLYSDNVSVINPSTDRVITNVSGVQGPINLVWDSSNNYVYVANSESGNLSVINTATNSVISNIAVGYAQACMAYDPSNNYLYVSDYSSDIVSVINTTTNSVIDTIKVGSDPSAITYDPSNGFIYVGHFVPFIIAGAASVSAADQNAPAITNNSSSDIIVIDPSTDQVISTINVGSGNYLNGVPEGTITAINYCPSNHNIYVASYIPGRVSVINTSDNQIVSNLTVNPLTTGMDFDPSNGYMYFTGYAPFPGGIVANSTSILPKSNYVSVLNPSTNLIVSNISVGREPTGIVYVPMNNHLYVTGSYSGTISVISTDRPYSVAFSESGLPAGNSWYVNITGQPPSGPITSSSYAMSLPNGTYSYSISTGNKQYRPSPLNGTFTVSGAALSQSIKFSEVNYTITFTESGLPPGTKWFVNVSTTSNYSTSTMIKFNEPNGTYRYSVGVVPSYAALNSSGTVTVNGQSQTLEVKFSVSSYTIKFVETGLPNGTEWNVSLFQYEEPNVLAFVSINSSNSSQIEFSVPNSKYSFSVGPQQFPPFYSPLPAVGDVSINGTNATVKVNFTRAYLLEFNESGLPNDTWSSVEISGPNNGHPLSSYNISPSNYILVNGTYSFSIFPVDGYYPYPSNGTVTIEGRSVYLSIVFFKPGYFTGTISPSNASIFINGTAYTTNNDHFNISLLPGTYEVKVSAPGYSTYTTNITISSSAVTPLQIHTLSKISKSTSFPFLTILAIMVVVIVVIAVAVVLIIKSRKG